MAPIRASVRDAVEVVLRLLPDAEPMSFRALVAGVGTRLEFAVRFLAVLELYRHGAISFEQLEPLGELTLRWTAGHWNDDQLANLGADYDN